MFDFNSNSSAAMGPQSLDDQAAQLKKRQMMAQMLTQNAMNSSNAQSNNAGAGLMNIGSAIGNAAMAGYLNKQNSADAELLKRNQLAQLLANNGSV